MKTFSSSRMTQGAAMAAAFAAQVGCQPADETEEAAEELATVEQGLTIETYTDDSASPVHTQLKICKQETPSNYNRVSCTIDAGYALVGGGAWAKWSS